MAKAVIFTCHKHAEAARMAAQAASRHMEVVLAVDQSESHLFDGENVVYTAFPRGGNLNGPEACLGVANLLLDYATDGYVVKIDSDTILNDPSGLVGYDIAGFPRPFYPPTLLGCAYGISRQALEHVIPCIYNAVSSGYMRFPEDGVITGFAQTLRNPSFRSNILNLKDIGLWHPSKNPRPQGAVINFGNFRNNIDWCTDASLSAMREYLNS